jgi:hypothetical protein
MPKYPNHLRAGAGQDPAFERRPELYSVRRPGQTDTTGAVAVFHDDAKTAFAVFAGKPRKTDEANEVGPVYSAGPGGPLAVPTGRVFVRLTEGVRPEERLEQLEAAGFEIERTVSYAPHAAWLRPARGGVAHALSGLVALAQVPDVVHVEPQMLLERALKSR